MGDRLRHQLGAHVKGRRLDDAHGTVPHDGFGLTEDPDVLRRGLRADVQTHPSRRDRAHANPYRRHAGDLLSTDVVLGKDQVSRTGGGGVDGGLCRLDQRGLKLTGADLLAKCLEKGVGHGPPEQNCVDLAHEVLNRPQLVGNLCPAQQRHKPAAAGAPVSDRLGEIPQLLFQKHPGNLGAITHGRGQRHQGGVGAVCGRERLVTVDVAVGRKRPRETLITFLLAIVKPQVLKDQDLTVGKRRDRPRCLLAQTVLPHETHRVLREKLPKPIGHGLEAQCRFVASTSWSPQMADQNQPTPAADDRFDALERQGDSPVVGDGAVAVERHVEVHPHQHPPAGHLHLLDRPLGHERSTG